MGWLGARTGPRVSVQGITDHYNVRGGKLELYGSPVTLLMLRIRLFPHTSSNNFQILTYTFQPPTLTTFYPTDAPFMALPMPQLIYDSIQVDFRDFKVLMYWKIWGK